MRVLPTPVVRVLAALCAVFWWVPMFGIIDLTVTWDPDWPVMLEAGWGLFFTFVVGLPFALIAVRPRRGAAATMQLWVATGVLALAAAVSLEWQAGVVAAVLLTLTALVSLCRDAEPMRVPSSPVDVPLAALAAVATPPWLVYAWTTAEDNRADLPWSDVTNFVDHYSVQAATALAMIALTALASVHSRGRRLHCTTVAIVSGYLGIVSLGWPVAAAGFSVVWSWLVVGWAVAVLVATWRRGGPGA